jgi:serine/threonine-protein kinase
MDVLVLLLEHAGEVVSTNQILDSVWEGRVVEEGAVHQKMSQIRAALGDHRERPTYIESITKRGYRTLQSVKLAAVSGSGADRARNALAPAALFLAAIVATLGAVLVALWLGSFGEEGPSADDPRVRQFTIDVPQPFADPRSLQFHMKPVVISPDSSRVVLHGDVEAKSQLYVRLLDTLDVVAVAGTEGAAPMFGISPDGAWVAFVDHADLRLKKVPLTGGTPTLICEPEGRIQTVHWGAQDTIVFDTNAFAGIFSVSAAGGTPRQITSPEDGVVHKHPHLLPDGKTMFFTVGTRGGTARQADEIYAVSLETEQQRALLHGASAQFVPPASMLYYRDGVLWSAGFDGGRIQVNGQSLPVADDVLYRFHAHYSASTDGTLVYVKSSELLDRSLVWVDLEGQEQESGLEQRPFAEPRISPQGDRVAVVIEGKSGADLWLYDLERGTGNRLTFDESREAQPAWTPDGEGLIYSTKRIDDLFLLMTRGKHEPIQLTDTPNYEFAQFVTRDGRQILVHYYGAETGMGDVGVLSVEGGAVEPLLTEAYNETGAALSPNEEWIAYASARSGRHEIYVRPYPNVDDGLWRVSKEGGKHPVWGSDSRLFYWGQTHIMLVGVATTSEFGMTGAKPLFSHQGYLYSTNKMFDFDRTNNRFLMVKKPPADSGASNTLVVIDNWPTFVRRPAARGEQDLP